MPNRLADQTSPYLRQHRDNPVDWYPWGDEAFAEATRRNVPILLSVGYSACHWCHVMAHESFEDVETASIMNELFVNVKVDREERPDVDAIYMDAVQAMTGRGGWPMTVFLSPQGKPFYGGTYYPKPTFIQLMRAIDDAWKSRRREIDENADALMEILSRTAAIAPRDETPGIESFDLATRQLLDNHDAKWGGFGGAPKFPNTMNIEVLLRQFMDGESEQIRSAVKTTLDAMASGGMYDHLAGGFARYSVDEKWLVPHFEKMLYDQALIIRTYLHAALALGERSWLQIVEESIAYVLETLTHEDGGFFSAEDADSLDVHGHSHEGHFYVFTLEDVRAAVSADLRDAAIEWWGFTEEGNFEGKNIPTRLRHRGSFVRSPEIEETRGALRRYRERRARPGLDDKVLAEWNGMMLATLAEAAFVLDRADWLDAARRNGEFLVSRLRSADGSWHRSWQQDGSPQARHHALAQDLAHLMDGFTRLGEATGERRWIDEATSVAEHLIAGYWDDVNGGFFTNHSDGERLVVRQKDIMDNATPSANSTAALALLRLASLTGRSDLQERAFAVLKLLGGIVSSAPTAFGNLLCATHLAHVGTTEVVVCGDRPDLVDSLRGHWLPTTVIAWGEPYDSPIWHERRDGLAYVCREWSCLAPSADPGALIASLRKALGG
jgi:uncharacterized protein YyaL (SSP411 family)